MRNPEELQEPYQYADEVPDNITIDVLPQFTIPDYDLADEDNFAKKYIPAIEKAVRESFEYREMIAYLREYMDMNKCAFYDNVTNQGAKVRIEIHHEPFSLYDICYIVYNKRMTFNESLEVEMVAKEVMYLHYNLLVGLIPLSETVHELVHNQYLFVPTDKVLGKYREFANRYDSWIPEQIKQTLDSIEKATQVYNEDIYKTILSKKYIYVNTTEEYERTLPKTEDIARMVRSRINTILNTNTPN